tara:strand:- start:2413 stop:2628 length:216 start_codon:yes stop_codon:yes gene_type:complete
MGNRLVISYLPKCFILYAITPIPLAVALVKAWAWMFLGIAPMLLGIHAEQVSTLAASLGCTLNMCCKLPLR